MENVYLSPHRNESGEKLLPKANDETPQDCEQALRQLKTSENKGKTRRYLKTARNFTVYALAFWGFFSIITTIVQQLPNTIHHEHHHHQHISQESQAHEHHSISSSTRRSCACGHSTTEAIALGCMYDSLSPAWLQPQCQDAELTAEFERLGDGPNGTWIYYADRNHTQELSMSEVMAMADDPDARFHVSWEWHVVHCYFYWIKQFRSQRTGVVVEARYDNEDHIRHCAKVFQNPVFGTSSGVVLNADYVENP